MVVIWCLRQSHRKSLGLLVPRLLDDINVPYLVKNTPEMNRRVVTTSQRRHGGSHLGAHCMHNFTNTQNGQTKQPRATESTSGNLFPAVGASRSVGVTIPDHQGAVEALS